MWETWGSTQQNYYNSVEVQFSFGWLSLEVINYIGLGVGARVGVQCDTELRMLLWIVVLVLSHK